jgi:hypothetical protein
VWISLSSILAACPTHGFAIGVPKETEHHQHRSHSTQHTGTAFSGSLSCADCVQLSDLLLLLPPPLLLFSSGAAWGVGERVHSDRIQRHAQVSCCWWWCSMGTRKGIAAAVAAAARGFDGMLGMHLVVAPLPLTCGARWCVPLITV